MKIGIIGAGAIGLTAGYELSKKGHEVTIFEKNTDIGGLMRTVDIGNEQIERLYHHIFTNDIEILEMIKELGMEDKMVWNSPKSSIYINHKLYPFSSPLDLLRFKELSLVQRVLMGMLVLRARFIKNWISMESTSAKEWIVQKAGLQVYEKLWGPLIQSKFDSDSDKISAVWIWNKFKLRGSTRGKDTNNEAFGYLNGSFGTIYNKMHDSIIENGGNVFCGKEVIAINQTNDNNVVLTTTAEKYEFNQVIMTGAPEILCKLIDESHINTPKMVEYLDKCRNMKYKANICVLLELTKELSPYYWVTIADPSIPFVLAIEHTNMIKDNRYQAHVVYLSRYLDAENQLFQENDDNIIEQFCEGLKQIHPSFQKDQIIKAWVFKERYTQPVVGMNYSSQLPEIQTPFPNLLLASMAQIYPEDRGQNYSIRLGKQVSEMIHNK